MGHLIWSEMVRGIQKEGRTFGLSSKGNGVHGSKVSHSFGGRRRRRAALSPLVQLAGTRTAVKDTVYLLIY